MRTISTFTLSLILLATGPTSAQDPAKSATNATPNSSPAAANTVNRDWVVEFWFDGNLPEGSPAKTVQDELLRRASNKVGAVFVPVDKYNIRDAVRPKGALFSPKEAFEKRPGWQLWEARLSGGDVLVQRGRVKNGKLGQESFPVLLGGPLDTDDVMDGLLKPIKAPQLITRPGDVLVLWHIGDKKQAALDCEAAVKSAQLKFEEYDITTPDGKAKFDRRMAKFSPVTRLKLMQEVKTAYLQRGWAMDNDTIQFGEPQELSTLVPVTDTATLFVSKTTDPAGGRKAPAQ